MKIVIWRITIHQIRSGQKSINQFVSYGLWALQPVIGTAENLSPDREHKCFNALQQNAISQICRTGIEGAYCDYEDPDKSRDPWTELVRDFQFFGPALVRGFGPRTVLVR